MIKNEINKQKVINFFLTKEEIDQLTINLNAQEKQGKTIYPPENEIFNAFNLCPFTNIKVVLLGQDPYHNTGQAHGLSFSVKKGVKPPPSLQNIFKEIKDDVGIDNQEHGNLENWAKQGVLLLNAVLTVNAHEPASHKNFGWEILTDRVIEYISKEKEQVVFLLWGAFAQNKAQLIDSNKHLVLKAPHPSPFSVHKGFFGCKHFSKTNDYLLKTGQEPINWTN